ncbi:phosphoribosylaminoimidazolesuccinocarboxamide synthase [Portibacter marinus]|uniref:phosphoribosylaminoimidazolesuccinocarboxamide synthase n=1 Tax=Portibacter marinus TaxID=2898660 RepID=UPI001F2F4FF1|nr:phosphoribosylaminoimidazolesuccinocarboxamide synthase [Portibacter marinus]
MSTVGNTNFVFPGQVSFYRGKVREVYKFEDKIAMVATDRISAFDHILPKPIPFKGQVLNNIAAHFLHASKDLVPNWLEAIPHPNVAIGKACKPIMLEMVIRGYLAGHAARVYSGGRRMLCGVLLPEGLKEGDAFPQPIITPATKAEEGHDEDISADEILAQGIVDEGTWNLLCDYTQKLFKLGTEMAAQRGLILVDTKYEFGIHNGQVLLMDEIHTPDSSRYYIKDGYEERQRSGKKQSQLSKEFVREWLMEHGFQGLEGQNMPDMPDDFVQTVSDRYIELYEKITGQTFVKHSSDNLMTEIEESIHRYLSEHA